SALNYSALIPAARITLPHLSVSSAISYWRARQRRAAHVSESRLDRGISKPCINLSIEPLDDFDGRTLRRGNAKPRACLEARNNFCDGGNVRQGFGTFDRAHRQWPQPIGTYIRDRRCHGRESDLDLSGDKISHCRAIATIRDVLKVGAGHCIEQLSRQMAVRP